MDLQTKHRRSRRNKKRGKRKISDKLQTITQHEGSLAQSDKMDDQDFHFSPPKTAVNVQGGRKQHIGPCFWVSLWEGNSNFALVIY